MVKIGIYLFKNSPCKKVIKKQKADYTNIVSEKNAVFPL